jgi:hypothetical protein
MERKKCGKCLRRRLIKNFNKKGKRFSSYCKDCNKSNLKSHYYSNPSYYKQKRIAHKSKVKAIISELKKNPCTDCGLMFHPCAMQFDHVPGGPPKKFNISQAVVTRPVGTVLKEIAKCELVCANCHAYRTYKRQTGKDPVKEF